MIARKRYDVVSVGSKWALTHLGITQFTHDLKVVTVEAGVRTARANQPRQLLIHRQDGTIEDERTYGDDPFPPRG